jgi:hypothetical protein
MKTVKQIVNETKRPTSNIRLESILDVLREIDDDFGATIDTHYDPNNPEHVLAIKQVVSHFKVGLKHMNKGIELLNTITPK